MTKISNIAKNTSYLTMALVLQKVISFTYFMLLARFLGPESLGKYYLAISLTTIFAIFIDLGFANVLTREVAKNQDQASKWLGNILSLKIFLSLLALVAIFIFVNAFDYDSLTKNLIYISCISMILDSYTSTFFSVARGYHNLKYESISSIIFQLLVLTVGYSALLLGGGLIPAMATLALASIYNFTYSWLILVYKIKVKVKLFWQIPAIKEILLISWPFAVYGIFQRLYTYLDSVLLSIMAGDLAVGLYQVAFKIIFALQFLPMAFTASLYPALSFYFKNNRAQLAISFERAMNYLIIISCPIIVGAIILADKIVLLFKEGYGEAVLPLQISIISLFFIFLNFPIGSLLNACDKQRKNTLNMGIVMVLSIVLNLILIPIYKVVGASITVLITNALMFILGMIQVRKIIIYHSAKNLKMLFKVLGASILMGLIIFYGKEYLNIFIVTLLGAGLYFIFLYLLGAIKKADISSIYKSFRKSEDELELKNI
ncbi:MAG: flippase [Patescibacteria group bacterium]